MNVYLAARYDRRAEMVIRAVQLQQHDITVTSRWIKGTHEENDYLPDAMRAKFAYEDLDDIKRADVMVLFAETKVRGRGGRHVELGYMLALQRPIVIVGGHEHIFSYLPEIVHVPDWDEALMVLYGWSRQNTELYKQHVQDALEGKSERYTLEELKRELDL